MFLICYVQILYSLFHNHTRSTCFFSIFFKIQQIVYLLHTGSCFGLMKSSILQGIASTGFVDLAPLQIDLLHPHLSLSSGQQIQFFDAWIAEHEMCSSFVYVEKVCFFWRSSCCSSHAAFCFLGLLIFFISSGPNFCFSMVIVQFFALGLLFLWPILFLRFFVFLWPILFVLYFLAEPICWAFSSAQFFSKF